MFKPSETFLLKKGGQKFDIEWGPLSVVYGQDITIEGFVN